MNGQYFSLFFIFSFVNFIKGNSNENDTSSPNINYAFITGKVYPAEDQMGTLWQMETNIHLKGGAQKGFIREDGSFIFTNVPPGSYIVEVTNPNYFYEPARVEITSKGKIRARKVNHIQTSQVLQVAYPLKMKPYSQIRYFQIREQWRITDFLFNPMVLMMVLPLLLVMVLPRMMNDPDARKEMEQFNNLAKYDMPEISELISTYFTGDAKGGQPKPKAVKQSKKNAKASPT